MGDADERVAALVAKAASGGAEPFCAFIYDLGVARADAAAAARALPPRCRLFYAMKANPDPHLLGALLGTVAGFEAASLGEVRAARATSATVPVLFGGPGKTDQELEGALAAHVRSIHVESAHELRRLDRIACRRGETATVLLRVNVRADLPAATLRMAGAPTQFGIDEAHLGEVLDLARRCQGIDLAGFHIHAVSNHLDADAHADLVGRYVRSAVGWAAAAKQPLRVLDAGGGIGVDYANPGRRFDWKGFGAALGAHLDRWLPTGAEVVFECGRALAARCGWYAVEVLDVKENHGARFAVVRGGTHHFRLPASWNHSHPFRIVAIDRWPHAEPRPAVADAPVTIVGQLCTPKDVLARDVRVPRLATGDVVLFTLAGAYGWTISHHGFLSHPHPEVIHVG
jgi:diaminopimelate decarboxylase